MPHLININDYDSKLSKKLPYSVDVEIRKRLDKEFKEYLELLKSVENAEENKGSSFIQKKAKLKELEKKFEKEHYKPYLEFKERKRSANLSRGNIFKKNFTFRKFNKTEKIPIANNTLSPNAKDSNFTFAETSQDYLRN